MKKALFIAWLALAHACMLHAQGVNVFDESSIGMGDSIDQEKYQVIYDLSYVYGNHHNKQGTNTNRITEQMLLQIGNLYSAFYSYPIFQRDSLIYSNMKKGIESNFSGNSGTINWKLYKNYPQQGKTAYLDFFCCRPIPVRRAYRKHRLATHRQYRHHLWLSLPSGRGRFQGQNMDSMVCRRHSPGQWAMEVGRSARSDSQGLRQGRRL